MSSAAPRPIRVVVHLVGPERVQGALINIANLRADLGERSVIEVVVNGPAVGCLLRDSSAAKPISDLIAAGIRFDACQNSLESQSLTRSELAPGVKIVKSGVAHVVQLQQDGYLYLRP